MDPAPHRDSRVLWYFWVACGLAATGAIAPLLLGSSGPSRLAGDAIPFGIAAVALAANALSYPGGRPLATGLYVFAWLAIVYGILRMVAIPLQLAVTGICPSSDTGCTPGFAAFSGGEGVAIGVGIVTGALALQVGLFGLRILYRGPQKLSPAARESATAPPPAVAATAVAAPLETASSPPDPAPNPAMAGSPPTRKPRTRRPPKPAAELPSPSEPAELPPHVEPAELPPHVEPAELPTDSAPPEHDSSTTSSS